MSPTPATIRAARKAAGLTQTQAAALVLTGLRRWQAWEYGENVMHPAFWQLFRLSTASQPPILYQFPA